MKRSEFRSEAKTVRYPVYILSKGRHDTALTPLAFDRMNIPYKLVVEPQEGDLYGNRFGHERVITTPFSNLGQGGIPSRNFIWNLSRKNGDKRHWIIDDNIRRWHYLNRNVKTEVLCPAPFTATEDFVDRYENVAIAGHEYSSFIPSQNGVRNPFRKNVRVFSSILLSSEPKYNDYEWLPRWNEDSKLSLDFLRDGHCSILMLCFLAEKLASMTGAGGNTSLYLDETDNRSEFVDELIERHPEYVSKQWKYDRWHMKFNYGELRKNKLIRRADFKLDDYGTNNYGMQLRERPGKMEGGWSPGDHLTHHVGEPRRDD